MYANAADFDDPKTAVDRHALKRPKELSNQLFQQGQREIFRNAEDDEAGGRLKRETENIGEIEIQGNEAALFLADDIEERLVTASLQAFIPHGLHIMAERAEYMLSTHAEVLVQLELHPGDTSTNRSRDISAP